MSEDSNRAGEDRYLMTNRESVLRELAELRDRLLDTIGNDYARDVENIMAMISDEPKAEPALVAKIIALKPNPRPQYPDFDGGYASAIDDVLEILRKGGEQIAAAIPDGRDK